VIDENLLYCKKTRSVMSREYSVNQHSSVFRFLIKRSGSNLLPLSLLISLALGSFYSLFLRDFQENLDDKVNFFLASLPNSEHVLAEQLKEAGDDSVYGWWRIGLLNNYPILKFFYLVFNQIFSFQPTQLSNILITSAFFLFLINLLVILWLSYVLFRTKISYKLKLTFVVFIGSVVFSVSSTFFGELLGNRLSSLGIVGLDTAPYGLSILGTLLSAGLDLGFIGSTPRGSSLLCIITMWIALISGRNRLAVISATFSLVIHISYGVIAVLLLFTFLTLRNAYLDRKVLKDTFVLTLFFQLLLYFNQPPNYGVYAIVVIVIYSTFCLFGYFQPLFAFKFSHIEIFIYTIYLFAALLKIMLLPEFGISQNIQTFLGLREGWVLFITEFPRRIALIAAPLCVITLSYARFSSPRIRLNKIIDYYAVVSVISLIVLYSLTKFTYGFPVSETINGLDVGPASTLYISSINQILGN
jgi:hypothetical protein